MNKKNIMKKHMKNRRRLMFITVVASVLLTGIISYNLGHYVGSKQTYAVEIDTHIPDVETASPEEAPVEQPIEPVEKVIDVVEEVKPLVVTDTSSNKNLGKFKITAYCHCSKCCGKSDGITASGAIVKPNHTIAVDPKVIPLGSEVIIDGHTYIAEDTGGSIKGNRIDMYFSTHQDALNFGVQYKNVTVNIK